MPLRSPPGWLRAVHCALCRLSALGSGTMLQMMLVDNLIHSDLHPGNILVRLDPPNGLLGLVYKWVGLGRAGMV